MKLAIKFATQKAFDSARSYLEGNDFCFTPYPDEMKIRFPYERELQSAAEDLQLQGVVKDSDISVTF